jgi:DNA ligase-associated metallophosphoesterase
MHAAPLLFNPFDQHCWLSPHRCLFWEEQKMLVLSDLHWGKSGHFRKHGLPVPDATATEDLHRLTQQMSYFQPEQVVIVGDMFHSRANLQMEQWIRWRNNFSSVSFMLIKGNHDILHHDWYERSNIRLIEHHWWQAPFYFVHDAADGVLPMDEEGMIISGHLHPGIAMKGGGKQSLRLPCYYYSAPNLYLPAFSQFSGMATIRPKKKDQVFAIVGAEVVAV